MLMSRTVPSTPVPAPLDLVWMLGLDVPWCMDRMERCYSKGYSRGGAVVVRTRGQCSFTQPATPNRKHNCRNVQYLYYTFVHDQDVRSCKVLPSGPRSVPHDRGRRPWGGLGYRSA